MSYQTCNYTILQQDCTASTCCLAQGSVSYLPSLAGNIAYLSIFAVLLAAQLGLGVWYRTWGFAVGAVFCCLGEIIGYVGRIGMHNNIFADTPFLEYIVALTIAPAFITASIYLSLSRLITLHGAVYARLAPRTYTFIFIAFDVIALLLQAAGGGMASAADSGSSTEQTGINIMIAGLAWQVASLTIFSILCLDYVWRVYSRADPTKQRQIYRSASLLWEFEVALALAVVLILIRSCYRVAELQQGFNGSLANNQVLFMVLEGPMVFIAIALLTVVHPGVVFGRSWGGLEAGKKRMKTTDVESDKERHMSNIAQ